MDHDARFDALRAHHRHHRHHHPCDCDLGELEAHLDRLQAEMAELLRRVPDPATIPVKVVVTVR